MLQEASLLDDLRALVEFAQAGFIAGATDRLYRTPSAITRQLQRLEAALGARGCRGLLGVKNGLTWKEWSCLLQCLSLLKGTFVVAMS